jgi:hypothetical protein
VIVRIEMTLPDGLDPSEVLEKAQELCVDLYQDEFDRHSEDESWSEEAAVEMVMETVSVEVLP